jgi:peroxiredoxin Q/BCP
MLEQGISAPEFILPDQSGEDHRLSDYRGQWVILYFYPKDMTSGCTTEACSFRDEFPTFNKINAVILGISKDSVKRHGKFAQKYELPFPLLSDENNTVCETYGVWIEKTMYGKKYMGIARTTYLINPEGKIANVYTKVNVKEHTAQLLTDLYNWKS